MSNATGSFKGFSDLHLTVMLDALREDEGKAPADLCEAILAEMGKRCADEFILTQLGA